MEDGEERENGKWGGREDGKWGGQGKWKMENGKWQTEQGERETLESDTHLPFSILHYLTLPSKHNIILQQGLQEFFSSVFGHLYF